MEWSGNILGKFISHLLGSGSHDNRWHADIKPDNILIIEEEDSTGNTRERFKLADPGFAKFVAKTCQNRKVMLTGGTETYGKRSTSSK